MKLPLIRNAHFGEIKIPIASTVKERVDRIRTVEAFIQLSYPTILHVDPIGVV